MMSVARLTEVEVEAMDLRLLYLMTVKLSIAEIHKLPVHVRDRLLKARREFHGGGE